MTLSGCGTMSAVDALLATAGLARGELLSRAPQPAGVSLKVVAGGQLNATRSGEPLSLVLKVYGLRSAEGLKKLSLSQLASAQAEKDALGEDLLSVRELVLLPGQSHEFLVKLPPEANVVGVAGLFRAPRAQRWKLAFDAHKSISSGIVVAAHACALSASAGVLAAGSEADAQAAPGGVPCGR